jgi:hypothetical protein
MSILQRSRDAPGEPEGFLQRELPVMLETMPQRLAFDVQHDVVQEPGGLAGIEQGQDVRVLEGRGEPDLSQETLSAEDGGQLGSENLERDKAVVLEVAS